MCQVFHVFCRSCILTQKRENFRGNFEARKEHRILDILQSLVINGTVYMHVRTNIIWKHISLERSGLTSQLEMLWHHHLLGHNSNALLSVTFCTHTSGQILYVL